MADHLRKIWQDKDRRRGLIATIAVHVLLLFALFFLALRTPLPLPGEEGVEVNFGYDDQGSGPVQSESAPPESQPVPQQPQPQPVSQPPQEIPEEEIVTQETEEVPLIEEKEEEIPEEIIDEPVEEITEVPEKPIEKPLEKQPDPQPVDSLLSAETEEVQEVIEEPKPVVNQRALFPGTSKNPDGTNQGITKGSGDMGKPQGYKDSDKYDGRGGEGNGIAFSLGGRGAQYLERPSVEPNESGDVVVDIWVDRAGNVTKAQIRAKGTLNSDPILRKIAVDAALNSSFTADPAAAELQRGTITYTFIDMKMKKDVN